MTFGRLWQRAFTSVLDLLAPPACIACDGRSGSQPFCPTCGAPPGSVSAGDIDGVPLLVASPYVAPMSTAIARLKYENRPELSRPLARLLAPKLACRQLPPDAALVPVPLHPKRLAARGYNQAALLAQELAALSHHGCHPLLLRRLRETERQVGKSRAERRENPAGAFTLRSAGPSHVVLVDDVVTTGSTVRACAQALSAGGIQVSAIVALAHAERR